MARAIAMVGTLVVLLHAAPAVEADSDPSNDVSALAAEANVDETDLLGAMATTGLSARDYLHMTGELRPPLPPAPPSVPSSPSAALAARVACIEAKESHGQNVANRQGSGASGVMQYMPSTFYAHAAEMGHFNWSPWVPWQAEAVAAHDLALGRRAQWTVSGC